ncbi:MAG: cytochrome C [Proteobacteria bacterium]|nr:cytochrome C [Pseudomonadota bacterium]
MRGQLRTAIFAALACAAPLAAGQADWNGVSHPARARVDYMLKCQGCHQPGGDSKPANTPPLAGEVAKFLSVPGGREFLGRVPGVAMTDLDDVRLAELLNWTIYRFDPGHLPAGFQPYTAQEIGALRRQPLRLDRVQTRDRLIAQMEHPPAK